MHTGPSPLKWFDPPGISPGRALTGSLAAAPLPGFSQTGRLYALDSYTDFQFTPRSTAHRHSRIHT